MTDLSLNYYGASGGFMALWVLLLGSDYQCKFKEPGTLDSIFKKHWNIQDHTSWKSTEIWPDNNQTRQSNIRQKIYFRCNPSDDVWESEQDLTRIFVYTDFDTQIQLSEFKNAFRNHNRTSKDVYPVAHFVNSYNNIKDPLWPTIDSFYDLPKLPVRIQNEVRKTLNVTENYVNDLIDKDRILINGEYVWKELGPKFRQADFMIKLQDIVTTNGNALLNKIGFETNDRVKDFISQWLGLHSEALQKRITGE